MLCGGAGGGRGRRHLAAGGGTKDSKPRLAPANTCGGKRFAFSLAEGRSSVSDSFLDGASTSLPLGGGGERETPPGFREEFRGVCGVAGGERERTSPLVVAGRAAVCYAAALPSGDRAPISFLRPDAAAAASLGRRRERRARLLLCLCVRASSFPLSLFLFTISGRKRLYDIWGQ